MQCGSVRQGDITPPQSHDRFPDVFLSPLELRTDRCDGHVNGP